MAVDGQDDIEVEVLDEPAGACFVARIGGQQAGFAQYRRMADRTVFTHTVVNERFEGHGVGSALIRAALDAERDAGHAIEPRCPFVSAFISRHPGYADLVPDAYRHLLDR
jgi:predicted GNAT family acetyltransferase